MSLDLKKQLISNKKFIADLIQGFVGEDKTLMFCYFSGSLAYGTFAENSDIDVTAFIDGLDFIFIPIWVIMMFFFFPSLG